MSTVTKGWIATGVYCAIALTPGVNLMLAFLLTWGVLVTFAPALSLIQATLLLLGASPPDWLVIWLAIAIAAGLVIYPTLRRAWRTARRRSRLLAVGQTAAMWVMAIAASFLCTRAL